MNRPEKIYENARKKSVKPYIKFTYKGQKYRLDKRILKSLLKKTAITVILIASLIKLTPAVVDKVSYALDVKNIALEQSFEANELLAENDLNVVPIDGKWNNDYYKIKGLSEKDLYGFCKYCGYDEAENVVKAIGYNSWDNYLSMKGYFDEDGNPSIRVWENYEEYRLVSEKEAKKNERIH